jgi:DNA-binding NarL/FixJ family response regulator
MRFDHIHQSSIDAAEATYGLTDDEREVLSLSRRGKSVVAIGLELGMSDSTVKRRRASLRSKIGI